MQWQAMVLADESFTELSKYFQRDARVLDYAERIFFDVRERLSADMLISYWCFGRPSHEDTYDEAIRKELLSTGYSLGPQYLRHLLEEIGAAKPDLQNFEKWEDGRTFSIAFVHFLESIFLRSLFKERNATAR